MAGFDVPKAKEVYGITEGYEPVEAILLCPSGRLRQRSRRSARALGYIGNPETLSEKLLQREQAPRTRKPLEEFVFSGSWKNASPLVIG